MINIFQTANEIMGLFQQIDDKVMQEALLCTMFDLMCEKHDMDKEQTIDRLAAMIKFVNAARGGDECEQSDDQ